MMWQHPLKIEEPFLELFGGRKKAPQCLSVSLYLLLFPGCKVGPRPLSESLFFPLNSFDESIKLIPSRSAWPIQTCGAPLFERENFPKNDGDGIREVIIIRTTGEKNVQLGGLPLLVEFRIYGVEN